MPPRTPPGLAVFAPSPFLTITIESGGAASDEIHVHAGGQGFWVARMAVVLGAEVTLCAPIGGESGLVLAELIRSEGVHLEPTPTLGPNGSYIHDRRSGTRTPVAEVRSPRLRRHEIDELYGTMVALGLRSGAALLTGPQHDGVLPGDLYRRLAVDLRSNGVPVIADLTGPALDGALSGGVDVLKLSSEELAGEAGAPLDTVEKLVTAAAELQRRGARSFLVSRAELPALALAGDRLLELDGPRFEALDEHGAGDSLVAGLCVGICRGLDFEEACRLGMAAGALNVTRRGLGSGRRKDIERLAATVRVRELDRGNTTTALRE